MRLLIVDQKKEMIGEVEGDYVSDFDIREIETFGKLYLCANGKKVRIHSEKQHTEERKKIVDNLNKIG